MKIAGPALLQSSILALIAGILLACHDTCKKDGCDAFARPSRVPRSLLASPGSLHR